MKNPAAPGDTGSLVERAYDWLKRESMADRLAAGQTIDDREIAAGLGLSRTPVREAIQLLRVECQWHPNNPHPEVRTKSWTTRR